MTDRRAKACMGQQTRRRAGGQGGADRCSQTAGGHERTGPWCSRDRAEQRSGRSGTKDTVKKKM